MWNYQATILRVIDADTLEASIDLGFSIYTHQSLRILDLDSPERNTLEGKEAIAYANSLFSDLTPEVTITTEYDRSFARYLASVTLSDGRDYAAVMKAAGHGA